MPSEKGAPCRVLTVSILALVSVSWCPGLPFNCQVSSPQAFPSAAMSPALSQTPSGSQGPLLPFDNSYIFINRMRGLRQELCLTNSLVPQQTFRKELVLNEHSIVFFFWNLRTLI